MSSLFDGCSCSEPSSVDGGCFIHMSDHKECFATSFSGTGSESCGEVLKSEPGVETCKGELGCLALSHDGPISG